MQTTTPDGLKKMSTFNDDSTVTEVYVNKTEIIEAANLEMIKNSSQKNYDWF